MRLTFGGVDTLKPLGQTLRTARGYALSENCVGDAGLSHVGRSRATTDPSFPQRYLLWESGQWLG